MVHSAQMRPKTPKSVVPFHHLLRPGLSCSNVGILYHYPPCKSLSRRSGRAVARKKLQPRRTHGPLYEISRMKSSNIISLIKKIKIDSLILATAVSGYAASRILFALSGAGIEIYPVDSVIQLLNTWASTTKFFHLWQRRIYHQWKEQHGLL